MLKIITSLTAALAGLLANAQTTETRNVSPFNKIEITDGVEVIYTQGKSYSVIAEATDLAALLTQSQNQTLAISCDGNACKTSRVYVTSPEIESFKAARGSKIIVKDRIETTDFSLSLASGATFNGIVSAKNATLKGKSDAVFNILLRADVLSANFQGGAKVNLSGEATKSTIVSHGNSLCNARNFITSDTEVTALETAEVIVYAKEKIEVTVSEGARVKYFGVPNQSKINPEAISFLQHRTNAVVAN